MTIVEMIAEVEGRQKMLESKNFIDFPTASTRIGKQLDGMLKVVKELSRKHALLENSMLVLQQDKKKGKRK